ncbi:F-box protein At1g11270-like [Lolium rigidum]|uniref:F-box protein At1g11270-like n=1 Tax=Lolium rigidum TaxID=89674 RepID=UPI001F5C55E8|nr:F-box protein At1g11270-like [Lolium rigidum]
MDAKRKSAMPSCGEAANMTVEVFQSNKRKKPAVSVCTLLLPHDMMLEVLLRLPVKSVLRFRAVCRPWAELFSSKDFCSLHMAASKVLPPAPKLLVVSPTSRLDSSAVYSCSPSGHRDDLLFTFDSARHDSVEVVTPSSCCGLTLLFDASAPAYYVCNAATRAITRLPPHRYPRRDYTTGLGFDDQTREYKVVRLINGYNHEKEAVMCHVYTPGVDCWRRAAGGVPFSLSQFVISAVDHAVLDKIPPVFANGFLHWLICPTFNLKTPRDAIILFSVAEETFGSIRSPPFWGPRENKRPWSQSEGEHLVVMDDQVCIVRNLRNGTPHGSALEIWGLLDYDSSDWSLNHRIDLFGHIRRELSDPQVVRVIGSVGNCRSGKKIMITTSNWVHEKFQKKVYTYDPRCQVLQCIHSVTETHTSPSHLIPGSRFCLFEESLAPVHKTDEDLALPSTLAKATIKKLLLQTESEILPMFQCYLRELASGGEGVYEGSSTKLPRRRLIIPAPVVANLQDF